MSSPVIDLSNTQREYIIYRIGITVLLKNTSYYGMTARRYGEVVGFDFNKIICIVICIYARVFNLVNIKVSYRTLRIFCINRPKFFNAILKLRHSSNFD